MTTSGRGPSPRTDFWDGQARVDEIIRADEAEDARLGVSFEDAGPPSSTGLLREGKKGLGSRVTVDRSFTVVIEEVRGALPCPVRGFPGRQGDGDYHPPGNSRALTVSDLSLHLLATHHFLQGKGSTFRLEPRELKDVLGFLSDPSGTSRTASFQFPIKDRRLISAELAEPAALCSTVPPDDGSPVPGARPFSAVRR